MTEITSIIVTASIFSVVILVLWVGVYSYQIKLWQDRDVLEPTKVGILLADILALSLITGAFAGIMVFSYASALWKDARIDHQEIICPLK